MTDELKYAAQECNDIRGLPPRWFDFDTLAITYGIGHTDAMFIVEASPDAVLTLKAENERLREALHAALEHPAEPVATVQCINGITIGYIEVMQPVGTKLYTSPPQRQWSSLTDDEIKEIVGPWGEAQIHGYTRWLFDKIDEALRKKNHD